MEEIAVIGGGAAGLAAAISAAQRVREADAQYHLQVVVCEASDRVGRSILATGAGRCNFSNARILLEGASALGYRNPAFVDAALGALRSMCSKSWLDLYGDPVLAFFARSGLMWREEDEGRLYPLANKASSVLDVLRARAAALGVVERCGCLVERIGFPSREGGDIALRTPDTRHYARAVVVACGGKVAPELFSKATPPAIFRPQEPVLGPLRTNTQHLGGLDGIRVKCAASVARGGRVLAREEGEVLFRPYGVSGIAVFDLSRHAREGDEFLIDFLPAVEDAEAFLRARSKALAASLGREACVGDLTVGMLLGPVAAAVRRQAHVEAEAACDQRSIVPFARTLKGFRLVVRGIGDPARCQVTRGGLDVGDVDPATMQMVERPRAFAAGEMLDVDGPCGGFNLHWAWASGLLAGRMAAESALS